MAAPIKPGANVVLLGIISHESCREITGRRKPDQHRSRLADVSLGWLTLAEVTKARLQNVTEG
jgi:hypothetical protein